MNALGLALRNVGAHRRRNLIVATVVALVSTALFLVLSFSDGELENIKYGLSTFSYRSSDIRVVRDDYKALNERGERDAFEATVKDYAALRDSLKALPFVEEAYAYAWRGNGNLLLGDERYSDYRFRYVDAANEGYLTSRYSVRYGRDFGPGDRNVVLLHESARRTTTIREGDHVKVGGRDFFGQAFSQDATVIGFYSPNIDNPNLMGQALCDDGVRSAVTGYAPGEMNGLEIRLRRGADIGAALKELNGTWKSGPGKGLTAYRADDLRGQDGNASVYSVFKLILTFISLVIVGIVSFGIMNVVSVNLHDRKKEIGTYYCLGSERPFLLWMYTWEILIVNVAGTAAGLALGLGVGALINALNITTNDPGTQLVFGGSVFRLSFTQATALTIVLGIAALSVATALATLGAALKVSPLAAMRETE